jgi:glycosyltransferase involved in cell wall biosynthesis
MNKSMNTSEAKKIVTNSYLNILNRAPDNFGLNYYVDLLVHEKINSLELELLLRNSKEFLIKFPETMPSLIYLNNEDKIPNLNIVAMYRIKNVERWIGKSLESVSKICNKIVIVDDGSTDDTVKICKTFSSVVDIHEQNNLVFDETRDKNLLLQMALKYDPDYILVLDGDEIIMPGMEKILYEDLIYLHPNSDVFEFQLLDMSEQPNRYRINNPLTNYIHKFLFKINNQKNLHFLPTRFPYNVHCARIPDNLNKTKNVSQSRVKILHYGYYNQTLKQKKYELYNKLDPNSTEFYKYEHLIHPEKFSIPDDFAYLSEGYYIKDI